VKSVIDLDPELTEAAAKVLGTTTKKDTVHAALAAVVAESERRAQRRARLLNSVGRPDLADNAVMSGAWS
jgi:Arc/MetJ family transcription regulator